MDYKAITLRPRVSEKTYGLSQEHNLYVFVVPISANKMTVSEAVSAQFGVTVENVNIIRSKGKAKRTVRRGGRPVSGVQSDFKKAYVTIKSGQSIPIFQSEDEKPKASKGNK